MGFPVICETCRWNGIYKLFLLPCQTEDCESCGHSIQGVCKCETCKTPDGKLLHHEYIPELAPE